MLGLHPPTHTVLSYLSGAQRNGAPLPCPACPPPQVRIWRSVRSQQDILHNMRLTDVAAHTDLVAYWKFNDAGEAFELH